MSQRLTLSVLRLQEAWGYVLMVIKRLTSSIWWGVFTSVKQLRACASNVYIYVYVQCVYICVCVCVFSRYFREELKQRIWEKASPGKAPQGPAPLQKYQMSRLSYISGTLFTNLG